MNRRRSRCETLLDRLESRLGDAGSLDQFLAALSRDRGRPIRVVGESFAGRGLVNAEWFDRLDEDVIVFDAGTSRPDQEHGIAHEIGHIVFDHTPAVPTVGLDPAEVDPDVLIRRMMARHGGASDEQEREAELFATLLLVRISGRAGAAHSGQRPATGAAAALHGLLGSHVAGRDCDS